jgi:hypothetical protein
VGASQRRKGHQFERDCAIDLRRIFPRARRHLEYQDGEAYGVDIEHTGKYRVQCKRGKRYAPIERIFEVQYKRGEVPILVTQADGKMPMAVIPWLALLALIGNDVEDWEKD